ncbi:hypothetical protein VaNZ11_007410 [Volvox africanus]|uniref:Uncharacterized protein n=1 Tax=Volvox africanus TaxID=51714 RepID=A0ABQ5S2T8_9CHLO|nr:hypothetical protein VaNZ11_007410 [Volvox africanus]
MMNIMPSLRSGGSAQTLATRAWACNAEGVLQPSTGATALLACAEGIKDAHLGIRCLSHWFCQAAVGDIVAIAAICSTRSPDAMSMSTTAAASSSAAGHRTQQERLEPVADISPSRLAKLADELDGPSASGSGGKGRQIRQNRRPTRAVADPSTSDSGWGVSNDTQVKAVFDKLVGNLTKSGKKATARRLVLDAVRLMQGHLRKGDLDKIK